MGNPLLKAGVHLRKQDIFATFIVNLLFMQTGFKLFFVKLSAVNNNSLKYYCKFDIKTVRQNILRI